MTISIVKAAGISPADQDVVAELKTLLAEAEGGVLRTFVGIAGRVENGTEMSRTVMVGFADRISQIGEVSILLADMIAETRA